MKNLYFLAIEGVIGAGKASLARLMAEKLNARLVLEKFEENPFLEDFYRDPERYAFQAQLYFLLSRYRQQIELKQIDLFTNLLISDYMFAKDKLFAILNLDEKELSLYNLVAQQLEKDLPKPDLVIYLQASTDRLMANIKKRGRSYEKSINRDYIDSINQIYNEFFFRYKDSPLIIVNTNEIDFVNNENDLNELIREIKQPISGTIYYNPAKKIL